MTNSKQKNYLPSYGRKRSRGLSSKLQNAYDKLPEFQISLKEATKLTESQNIILEIGFGNGEHFAHLAKIKPDSLVVGSEIFINGVANALHQLIDQGSQNAKIYDTDCRELLEAIPDNTLSEIYILFPDPWPKERHHKRRIINEFMLKLMHKKLKKGGVVRFASDIEEYYDSAFEQFLNFKAFTKKTNSKEGYQIPENHIQTKYQRKAIKEGRVPNFFEFVAD